MTEQQIPKLVASLVEHQNAFSQISTENGQWAIQNTAEAIKLFVVAVANRAKQAAEKIVEKLLESVGTITVLATTKKFQAGANFLLKQDGGICSYLGDNFRAWFLEGDGKTEEPIGEQTLCYAKLRKASVDGPIVAELGGKVQGRNYPYPYVWPDEEAGEWPRRNASRQRLCQYLLHPRPDRHASRGALLLVWLRLACLRVRSFLSV